MKNRMFFGTSISDAFCKDFGRVLEAKILDFRIFFDVFSMSFYRRSWKGEKNDQDEPTRRRKRFFGAGLR